MRKEYVNSYSATISVNSHKEILWTILKGKKSAKNMQTVILLQLVLTNTEYLTMQFAHKYWGHINNYKKLGIIRDARP